MDLDRFEEARDVWQSLTRNAEISDSLILFDAQSVVCLYRLNRTTEGRDAARDLYKKHKNRSDLDEFKALFYLEKGRAADRVRNFKEALEQYDIISDKFSSTEWVDDAQFARGLSLLEAGDIKGGSAVLQRIPDDFPESNLRWGALLALGAVQYREGGYPEAAAALNRVWENDDAHEQWHDAFGLLLRVYKDARFYDAAIRLNRQYLQRFPDAPDLTDRRMDIGWLFMQLGEWDEAIRQYQPLLPMADAESEAETQYYIGEAYQAKGEYRTAILEFLKVRILGRKTKLDWGLTALYKAGNCYEKLNDNEGAARMYRKIIDETGATSNYGITAQKRLDDLKAGR
jgi:tetratricopeptide (TPR) repeat protein